MAKSILKFMAVTLLVFIFTAGVSYGNVVSATSDGGVET